jgi:Macrocin-O-methyltransferase (TylF)
MSTNEQSPSAGNRGSRRMIKRIGRRAALSLPGLRPLLKAKERHAAEAKHLASEVKHLASEAKHLASELARSTQEREALELELYLLRSTHQRAVARNDELLTETQNLRAEAERAAREAAEFSQLRAEISQQATGLLREVGTHYAKLAGQLTMSSSEISSSLRAIISGRGANSGGDPERYLDLLEKALTGELFEDAPISPWTDRYDPTIRAIGRDWPGKAPTMIGAARMRNIRELAERALDVGVPGDFLEAGVWRGGACIYMRGILAAHGETERRVWVADSFAGLPPPDPDAYPADQGDPHHQFHQLVVPLDEVKGNFTRYGLLDEQVRFLPGWFADTLPQAPIARLAILRLDGDMYSSTIQTLNALYDKVTLGGYVIIDDYILEGCRRATDDFRASRGIAEAIQDIDGAAIYWRKDR